MSVKHTLLALLDQTPAHGYQLHGLLSEALGEPWSINTGQIYSTLSRLEQQGLVLRSDVGADETDRTVYELTEVGRQELTRWFLQPVSRADRLRDAFYAKLVLSCLSDTASPPEVLQSQRRQLMGELQDLTQLRRRADSEGRLAPLLLLESGIGHLEADLRWLDLCERRLEELQELPRPEFVRRPRGRPPKEGAKPSRGHRRDER